jgi:hypothetical protein
MLLEAQMITTAVSLVTGGGTTERTVSPVHNVFDVPAPHTRLPGRGRIRRTLPERRYPLKTGQPCSISEIIWVVPKPAVSSRKRTAHSCDRLAAQVRTA